MRVKSLAVMTDTDRIKRNILYRQIDQLMETGLITKRQYKITIRAVKRNPTKAMKLIEEIDLALEALK